MQVKSKLLVVALLMLWGTIIIFLVSSQYIKNSHLFDKCVAKGFVFCFNSILVSLFFLFIFVSFLVGWLILYLKVLAPMYKKMKITKESKVQDESLASEVKQEY